MKNLILIFFIFSLTSYSQSDVQQVEVIKTDTQIVNFAKEIGQQEFRIDFFDLLLLGSLQVGYEKMNDTSTALGVTTLINFGDVLVEDFALTPYFRLYFLESEEYGGYGFFAEVFSRLAFGETEARNTVSYEEENFFDIAPGAAIGQKWVNKKGWTFEVSGGVGRFLLNKDENNSSIGQEVTSNRPGAIFRGGFSIGKRF